MNQNPSLSRTGFPLLVTLTGATFVVSIWRIAMAPYQDTMGLIQKIFYFHVPSWMAMGVGVLCCGVGSAVVVFRNSSKADRIAVAGAELSVLFGLCGLVSGPLWARKAWGTWWTWDPKLTIAFMLVLIFVSFLLVRRFGGPGSDKLAAAVGLFGLAVAPFVYVATSLWRTIHPMNTVVPTLVPGMRGAFWWSSAAFVLLSVVLLTMRVQLEERRAEVDDLYREREE